MRIAQGVGTLLSHVLMKLCCHSPSTFNRLEAPMISPLAESPAGIKSNALHPGMNCAQAGFPIEIEHHVGVGDVYLISQHNAVRVLQNTSAPQRVDYAIDQPLFVQRLPARVSDFARDRAVSR